MRELLIDESQGIYIPSTFFKNFDFDVWGLDKRNFPELIDVEHEHYWEAWDDVLRDAKYIDNKGNTWYLEQDGDLFAYTDQDVNTD